MRRTLRLLLVCLLAMALPFKAIAGLTMPGWALAPAEAVAVIEDQAAPAVVSHDHCHGHAGAAVPDPADPASIDPHGHATGKCSSCSPCSLVAGPAPQGPVVPETLPAHRGASHPPTAVAGVVADVPHEPPRARLH